MPPTSDDLAKLKKFQGMVDLHPDNELARFSLGSCLFDAERYADAELHFARALELKSDWVMAYLLRARCLIRLRRYDEARPLLDKGREHSIQQGHEGPVEEIDDILEDLPPTAASGGGPSE